MAQRAVSIEDLARMAGVSHSTVSRALRNSPLISAEVRERIQDLAQETGYTPNAIAQSLQTQRTNTIGLVITTISDPFLGDVVKGVEEIARRAGMSVFLSTAYNDPQQEMHTIETFHRRRVDGILVASTRISSQHTERLARIRVPTVLISSQTEDLPPLVHSVAIDDYHGAKDAVNHLLQLGHRSIGYIGVGNRPYSNQRRLQAYQDSLAVVGVVPPENWVAIASTEHRLHEDDVGVGQSLLPMLLNAGVTAVFCYNDMVAVGVLMGCRRLGVNVPEQLSVIGFDDSPIAQYVMPPLTTIQQPKLELGQTAMSMLLDVLNGKSVQNSVLFPTLVVRSSTANLVHT